MKNVRFALCIQALILAATVSCLQAKGPSVGKSAPLFALQDVQGQRRELATFKGKYVVLEWINPDCPFVRKHYGTGNMQSLQKEFTAKGVAWLSICSSAEGKQGRYAPADWQKMIQEQGFGSTAVLLDSDGKVGKLYEAKTTPHMFVIDPAGKLIYKGAIDDKPTTDPADVPSAKNYVRAALEQSMAGQPVADPATTSYGCSVKYK